ncbi:Secretion system C-terminal sorting domain-containing protein [Flavobacterium branchiophilum]|uniref:Secretion system C-terminal sorting domain-containing protein n=1 Tax=Flavobacterium branchiophilum (strain FL-15) TaxID=1034807 RepID=G2Z6Z4_FLABF|nr:T9SS type A sorting domain-containing protein [Flavobacterium branchiophilum]CCB68996.1 Hypothetical protein precursor [Flavobacterium branchiophilum FL-15]
MYKKAILFLFSTLGLIAQNSKKIYRELNEEENNSIYTLFKEQCEANIFVDALNSENGNAVLNNKNISRGIIIIQKANKSISINNSAFIGDAQIIISAKHNVNIFPGSLIAPSFNGDVTIFTSDFNNKTPAEMLQSTDKKNSTSLYPNPTKGNLTIKLSNSYTHGALLYVYDSKGALVMEQVIKDTPKIIDTVALPVGVYMATLISEDNRETIRFVKE